MPRPSWSSGLEATSEGMRRSEGDPHPACGFDDAGGDLDQAHPQGGEPGNGQRLGPGNGVTEFEHQPMGAGVQHETHLIGERRTATGAVGCKLGLVQFDQVLGGQQLRCCFPPGDRAKAR